MATVANVSEAATRRKYGYLLPSLRVGLVDDGETIGTCATPATCVALTDAPEHPAPMIALTPCSLKELMVS
eukprot:5666741-Prymnesium_polylepis.1